MRVQSMLERHESDAFRDLALHMQSEDTSTPSSPSQGRAGGHLLSIASTFSQKFTSVVGDAFHTGGCNSPIAEDSACCGHVDDWNTSSKLDIPQPRFNDDAPFALSGVAFGTTAEAALQRRIERVQDASFYLERFTFNFTNLTNTSDHPLASVSNNIMAWDTWTAGIGSQFDSSVHPMGGTGINDGAFSSDLF